MDNIIELENINKTFYIPTENSIRNTIFSLFKLKKKAYLSNDQPQTQRKSGFIIHKALEDINLNIKPGERVAIMGHNGAGKSTLVKIILKIYKPTSGIVKLSRTPYPLSLNSGLVPLFTGRENIFTAGSILGYSPKSIKTKLDSIIKLSNLGNFIDAPISIYSSGMKTRLAFAIAWTLASDFLVVDEAFVVGDSQFQNKIKKIINKKIENNLTLIMVTHSIQTAKTYCNRIIKLDHGKVSEDKQVK